MHKVYWAFTGVMLAVIALQAHYFDDIQWPYGSTHSFKQVIVPASLASFLQWREEEYKEDLYLKPYLLRETIR